MIIILDEVACLVLLNNRRAHADRFTMAIQSSGRVGTFTYLVHNIGNDCQPVVDGLLKFRDLICEQEKTKDKIAHNLVLIQGNLLLQIYIRDLCLHSTNTVIFCRI